ncbi:MAG: efflux RND transporter periplasmic adaptor subunit [Burkholderiaceae bacterium]
MCKAIRMKAAPLLLLLCSSLPVISPTAFAQGGPAVSVMPAGELGVYPQREAMAAVEPRNESRMSAQVSAVINEILVDVGEQVRGGDVLAKLDTTDIRLAMAQAMAVRDGLRARLKLAQRQLKRLRDLKTNNFVSTEAVNQRDAEVVSLSAELKGSDAQVAIMRRQLDKSVVRAPFDGVVSQRFAQLGELAAAGAVLFTLVEVGGEVITADISAGDAGNLSAAARYEFVSNGRAVPVRLQRVSPVVSRPMRTRQARFVFTDTRLPAGTEGRLRWADARSHMPPEVLVRRDNQLGVFVVRDAKAEFVALPLAQEGRPAVSVLNPEAFVVTNGQPMLQPGDAVDASPVKASGRPTSK